MTEYYDQKRLLEYLQTNDIPYEYYAHPAVYTSEAAELYTGNLGGFHAKNLFLMNDKRNQFFLVVCHHERKTNLKDLGGQLKVKHMSFASPERMQLYLGITPGAVSPLALINDFDQRVQAVFEQDAWDAPKVLCHPVENTASLMLNHDDLVRFLRQTGHEPVIVQPS